MQTQPVFFKQEVAIKSGVPTEFSHRFAQLQAFMCVSESPSECDTGHSHVLVRGCSYTAAYLIEHNKVMG